jgi:hypothetical protein
MAVTRHQSKLLMASALLVLLCAYLGGASKRQALLHPRLMSYLTLPTAGSCRHSHAEKCCCVY